MTYHLLYTLSGRFHDELRAFRSFHEAEAWLESIGATYWEIGIPEPRLA